MDNVSFHHCKEVVEFIHSQNWKILYTPPYSPWFSPIEGVFSVVKNHYRKFLDIDLAFQTDLRVSAFVKNAFSICESPITI